MLLCCITTLFFLACKKEEIGYTNAVITGPDFSMCPCCGGWFVNVNDSTYRFYELPAESNLDLNTETFPLEVKMVYIKTNNACMEDLITVKKIKKR